MAAGSGPETGLVPGQDRHHAAADGPLGQPTRFAERTLEEVADYWVTGLVTITDLVDTSRDAVAWHHNESRDLANVAETASWTRQVWWRDRRFIDLLPRVDATVYDIAVAGSHVDQRQLYSALPALRQRIDELAVEFRDTALIRYVMANTGQSEPRTVASLQCRELLEPAISGAEAGRQLGVSPQRIYQLSDQIRRRIQQAQPPSDEVGWLPQDPEAIETMLS